MPVDVKITYYLDGQEIAPENLAGKSGKVKIRFDYTNNSKKTVKVNGKEESREVFNTSNYQASPKIVRVGTASDSQDAVNAVMAAIGTQDEATIQAAAAANCTAARDAAAAQQAAEAAAQQAAEQAAQQAAQQASQSAGSTAGGKTEVSRQAYDDCDGSGHGYYEITYSDGSTAIEEY